jgi:hypothetical protein
METDSEPTEAKQYDLPSSKGVIKIVCKMTFCMVLRISVALQDKLDDLFSSPTSIFGCPGLVEPYH